MNCFTHSQQFAVAICIGCGIALCSACCLKSRNGKTVCSERCTNLVNLGDDAIQHTAIKMQRSNKVTAWLTWLSGTIFLLLGLGTLITTKDIPFSGFLIAMGVIFIASGFWYSKIGRKGI